MLINPYSKHVAHTGIGPDRHLHRVLFVITHNPLLPDCDLTFTEELGSVFPAASRGALKCQPQRINDSSLPPSTWLQPQLGRWFPPGVLLPCSAQRHPLLNRDRFTVSYSRCQQAPSTLCAGQDTAVVNRRVLFGFTETRLVIGELGVSRPDAQRKQNDITASSPVPLNSWCHRARTHKDHTFCLQRETSSPQDFASCFGKCSMMWCVLF